MVSRMVAIATIHSMLVELHGGMLTLAVYLHFGDCGCSESLKNAKYK